MFALSVIIYEMCTTLTLHTPSIVIYLRSSDRRSHRQKRWWHSSLSTFHRRQFRVVDGVRRLAVKRPAFRLLWLQTSRTIGFLRSSPLSMLNDHQRLARRRLAGRSSRNRIPESLLTRMQAESRRSPLDKASLTFWFRFVLEWLKLWTFYPEITIINIVVSTVYL